LSFLGGTSGQAMVEFAIVLPILAMVMFGLVKFAIVFKDSINVTNATRVAARAAVVARFGGQTNCGAANNAASNAGLHLASCRCNPSGSTPQCTTTDASISVTVDDPGGWNVSVPFFSMGGPLASSVTESLE
jgi:Flp pilus assembly protein TadG